MRCRQTRAQAARKFDSFVTRQPSDAPQQRAKILSIHILHRDEWRAFNFSKVVNTANVSMRNLTGDPDFVAEEFESSIVAGRGLRQELQRDGLIEFQVVRTVNLAHSATPNPSENSKPLADHTAGGKTSFI
jgi:hypothetical protein